MRPTIITCYQSPDLDGFAGVLAYAEFLNKTGQSTIPVFFAPPRVEALHLISRFNIEYPAKPIISKDDEFILVDASDVAGLSKEINLLNVKEIIDHRQSHELHEFPNAKLQLEMVGAAATLVAEKFFKNSVEISEPSAILLYGAIVSNTLNFRGNVTTPRDVAMAKWLKDKIKLPADFVEGMFAAKSDLVGDKLRQRIKADFAHFLLGGKKIGFGQIEIIGVPKLLTERKQEVVGILNEMKAESNFDFVFISIIDLEEGKNVYITSDLGAQELLHHVLDIDFKDNIATGHKLIMRKETVPLLKVYLEK